MNQTVNSSYLQTMASGSLYITWAFGNSYKMLVLHLKRGKQRFIFHNNMCSYKKQQIYLVRPCLQLFLLRLNICLSYIKCSSFIKPTDDQSQERVILQHISQKQLRLSHHTRTIMEEWIPRLNQETFANRFANQVPRN